MDGPIIARRTCNCVNRYCGHHQALRLALTPAVINGTATCWRCTQPITPDEAWDVGHVDGDPTLYAGHEHARCNRATAGRQHAQPRRWSI
jgi:hypothetical protein